MSRDDQRLRELAHRLVAMAPEPPPFPEEQVTLSTQTPQSRPRPVLAFIGAALLVLVGAAIPLVLLNSNGSDPVATTAPPAPDTTQAPVTTDAPATTQPSTDTSEPTQTTQPTTGIAVFGTSVFLVQDPENSFTGNPALVAFWTEIEAPEDSSIELLALELLSRDDLVLPAPGYYNAIPPAVEFLGLSREGSAITIEVNEAFRDGAGGLLADMTMLNQIVHTATVLGESDEVLFLIDGQEVTDFGTDGLDLTGGLTRETFRDSLNPILVTQPIYVGDGLPTVTGVANVFEATVSLDIVDTNGDVTYQDFTTATCGTGCWGEFGFALDTPGLSPGYLVRVFWNSAEDGSPSDVVYVPYEIPAAWDFTPNP